MIDPNAETSCPKCGHWIHDTKINNHNCEYLRRNLLVGKALGAQAQVQSILTRLRGMKNPPEWLVNSCCILQQKLRGIPEELVKHREEG